HRCLDLLHHLGCRDDTLAVEMAALLRKNLVLELNGRSAGPLKQADCPDRVHGIAEPGIGVDDNWQIHGVGHRGYSIGQLRHGCQADIGHTQVHIGNARASGINDFETEVLNNPGKERIRCARNDKRAPLLHERFQLLCLPHRPFGDSGMGEESAAWATRRCKFAPASLNCQQLARVALTSVHLCRCAGPFVGRAAGSCLFVDGAISMSPRPNRCFTTSRSDEGSMLKPIKVASLASEAFDRVVDAITSGEFEPGEKISESRLARELGISRGPIREALQRLEGRLVVRTPRLGVRVIKFGRDELLQLFYLREAVEGMAARLAAMNATPRWIQNAEAMLHDHEKNITGSGSQAYRFKSDRKSVV